MQQHISRVWLSLYWSMLWLNVFACASPRHERPSSVPFSSVASARPEKTKIVVLRFENSVKKGKVDKGSAEDRLFGNGIRAQIVRALEQSGRFTVLTNSGSREVLQRDTLTDSGEIKRPVRERLGSLRDAELLLAGTITTYQLSRKSKNAGVEADLFFCEPQAQTIDVDDIVDIARKTFEGLKPVSQDRIALELWLFDARTGKRLAITKIEGTPSDSTEEMETAMQQAVQGTTIKVANWIGGTERAFRAGTLAPPLALETKAPQILERDPARTGGDSPIKQSPVSRSRAGAKAPSKASGVETEKPVPAASTTEIELEDFSEAPPRSPVGTGEKPLPQEEWGEQ